MKPLFKLSVPTLAACFAALPMAASAAGVVELTAVRSPLAGPSVPAVVAAPSALFASPTLNVAGLVAAPSLPALPQAVPASPSAAASAQRASLSLNSASEERLKTRLMETIPGIKAVKFRDESVDDAAQWIDRHVMHVIFENEAAYERAVAQHGMPRSIEMAVAQIGGKEYVVESYPHESFWRSIVPAAASAEIPHDGANGNAMVDDLVGSQHDERLARPTFGPGSVAPRVAPSRTMSEDLVGSRYHDPELLEDVPERPRTMVEDLLGGTRRAVAP